MNPLLRFKKAMKKVKNVVVTTHIRPDADGLGSEIALCLALRTQGKKTICVNETPLFSRYRHLDVENTVISCAQYFEHFNHYPIDLLIITDTNSLSRIGPQMQKLAAQAKDILFVDHHPCSKKLQENHCIETSYAATGELVGHLIEEMGISFNQKIALPLYTSILIDTNCFRYPTVSGRTHRIIAKLVDTGIAPSSAYNSIYGTQKISHMQLLGKILSSSQTTDDGSIAWITLSEEDLKHYDVNPEDTLAFINHLLVLEDVKMVCMFRQEGDHIKVSFRSHQSDIDVGHIAQRFEGGGHHHSAATLIKGSLKDVTRKIIKNLTSTLSCHLT